jgi:hypothetical protein
VPHHPTLAPRPPTRRRRRTAAVRSALAAALALISGLALASSASALEQQLAVARTDAFGFSVAVQGDTLVVGALAQSNGAGAAYVYQRTGDTWNQTAKLVPTDSAIGDSFGQSVAIDGDTIAVGAPEATIGNNVGQGAVYTFTRSGIPNRTESAKLTASDGAAFYGFGNSVAISGETIVAGAPFTAVGKNTGQGAVYTFTRVGAAARTETAKLTASDGVTDAELGHSVAIDGDTVVAGARGDTIGGNARQGSAYTFASSGANARTETAKLTASNGLSGAQFGQSVAIDGDTILVGAPSAFVGGVAKGAVYTFTRTGASARTENATLSASDGTTGSFLGFSVAIDPDTILAGASEDTIGTNTAQGSAYTFSRTGLPGRRQAGKLSDADGATNDFFGFSVALDAGTTVVGAAGRGEVSVFFSPAPPPPPVAPPSSSPPPPPAVSPVLSKLTVNPRTIHHSNGSLRSKSPARGAISFTLSMPATVRLSVAESLTGRMTGSRCIKPTRANNRKRHCTRTITVRRVAVRGTGGTNSIPLAGRTLHIGSYRLTATPTNGTGGTGTARSTTFRIVK